jgi:hypothetical protein
MCFSAGLFLKISVQLGLVSVINNKSFLGGDLIDLGEEDEEGG